MHAVRLGVHLRQDARKFPPSDQQIVRPANVRNRVQFFGGGVARRQSRDEREQGSVCRRDGRAQQHCAMNSRGLLRQPRAARAAAPRRLLFREHYSSVRLACFTQAHCNSIGRVHFEEMIDPPGKRRAVESMAQQLRNQNVGRALDVVAGAGVSLNAYAQLAQRLNPAPHLLPRHANFFGDLRAADDDGRILGKERQQPVNAPVSCAGKSCQSFGRHRE